MKVYCNGKKRGHAGKPTAEPSTEWAGEGYCKATAGRGTDHVGAGRCKHHAGASTGPPIKHGRYSVKHNESLGAKIEAYFSDDRYMDLRDELALQRALLQDFLDRIIRSPSAEEMGFINDLVRDITLTTQRLNKIITETALTDAEIKLLRIRLADVVLKYVPDEERAACARDIRSLGGLLSGPRRRAGE